MNCPNCGAEITCSCQRRIASDGVQCCEICVMSYQQKLHLKQLQSTVKEPEQQTEQIITVTATTVT